MKVTEISTNNCMQKKIHGRIRNPLVTRHPRNTTQQLPPNYHEVQGESMSDQKANCIPTTVNGQINPTKRDNNITSMNNKLDHMHNLVRESTVKLLNNKAKYSKCFKHKVLLIGDSHMNGYAATMIASLYARFGVCGVVKPGLVTGTLTEMVKGTVGNSK
jgi:hypothetical protein